MPATCDSEFLLALVLKEIFLKEVSVPFSISPYAFPRLLLIMCFWFLSPYASFTCIPPSIIFYLYFSMCSPLSAKVNIHPLPSLGRPPLEFASCIFCSVDNLHFSSVLLSQTHFLVAHSPILDPLFH